jgi:hypothetical protein
MQGSKVRGRRGGGRGDAYSLVAMAKEAWLLSMQHVSGVMCARCTLQFCVHWPNCGNTADRLHAAFTVLLLLLFALPALVPPAGTAAGPARWRIGRATSRCASVCRQQQQLAQEQQRTHQWRSDVPAQCRNSSSMCLKLTQRDVAMHVYAVWYLAISKAVPVPPAVTGSLVTYVGIHVALLITM